LEERSFGPWKKVFSKLTTSHFSPERYPWIVGNSFWKDSLMWVGLNCSTNCFCIYIKWKKGQFDVSLNEQLKKLLLDVWKKWKHQKHTLIKFA
jgi:hypothetical protein